MSLTPEVHLTLSQRTDPVYPVGTHLPGPSSARTPRPHRGPRHGHLHVCVLRTFTPRQGQHGPAPQHALISRRFRGSTGLGFGSGCRDMGRGPRGGDDGRMPPKQMVGKPHAQAPLSQDLPLWPPPGPWDTWGARPPLPAPRNLEEEVDPQDAARWGPCSSLPLSATPAASVLSTQRPLGPLMVTSGTSDSWALFFGHFSLHHLPCCIWSLQPWPSRKGLFKSLLSLTFPAFWGIVQSDL